MQGPCLILYLDYSRAVLLASKEHNLLCSHIFLILCVILIDWPLVHFETRMLSTVIKSPCLVLYLDYSRIGFLNFGSLNMCRLQLLARECWELKFTCLQIAKFEKYVVQMSFHFQIRILCDFFGSGFQLHIPRENFVHPGENL